MRNCSNDGFFHFLYFFFPILHFYSRCNTQSLQHFIRIFHLSRRDNDSSLFLYSCFFFYLIAFFLCTLFFVIIFIIYLHIFWWERQKKKGGSMNKVNETWVRLAFSNYWIVNVPFFSCTHSFIGRMYYIFYLFKKIIMKS